MAISFLDNVTLGDNQLQNVVIQVLASDPTGVTGKLIYNSTSNVLKYYNGSGWISLTADTQGMVEWDLGDGSSAATISNGQEATFAAGTGITTSLNTRTITITNSKPFDSLTLASTSGSNSTIANSGTITLAAGTGITTTNNGSGQVTIAATGAGTMSSWTLSGDSGTNQSITDGNTVDIAGGTNISTVVGTTDTVTINLDDTIALTGTLDVEGTGQSSFAGQVTIPTTPSASTDAASKAYVDSSVVGNLVFQGGYDASTNDPDLDSNPSSSIKKGWSYVVTVAGLFFTEKVEVGDLLIAQQDAPTTLAHWVTVQNNIGLATASSVGIGNVAASTDSASLGIGVSYSSGTASVGWSIKSLSTISNAVEDADFMAILDEDTNDQKKIALSTLKTYFTAGVSQGFAGTSSSGTSHTFNHNLGTYDVIVQVYDASNYETVYASVDRTSINQVIVTTAASANIRCLINNVG